MGRREEGKAAHKNGDKRTEPPERAEKEEEASNDSKMRAGL